MHFIERKTVLEGVANVPDALRSRFAEFLLQFLTVGRALVHAIDADFEAAQSLLERFLEGAADGHHLADRLHLRRQARIGGREFLESKTRHFGDDVVNRRLERRRRLAASNFVGQFVKRVTNGQLGCHLGDREAGGLRRQCRRARDARVHLDDDHAAVGRADRELHVRTAGIDADLAQDGDRRVAHDLVFLVGQRLRRRDGDRVAGMHAHRIEVLDRADDDAVVLLVADHLHLEFFPADQ